MEDQGKRLLVAAGLAMLVIVGMNLLFPEQPPPEKPADKAAEVAKPAGSPVAQPAAPAPGTPDATPVTRGPEQEIVLSNGVVRAVFTNHGGGLKSWRLLDKKYERDPQRGELVAQPAGIDPVVSLAVSFVDSTYTIPPNTEWQGEKLSETQVRYRYQSPQLEVTKTFTYYPGQYLLKMAVDVAARGGDAKQRMVVSTYGYQDPKIDTKGGMGRTPREWRGTCLIGDDDPAENTAAEVAEKERKRGGVVGWAGFTHPYMLVATAVRNDEREAMSCDLYPVAGAPGLMQSDLVLAPMVLKAGEAPTTREVVAYLGPKFYDKLEESSAIAGFPTRFEEAMDLGWFAFLGRPLLWLMLRFYELVGNWGIAIILLTFLVKLATLYWTQKSMRSMQAMVDLKPKIDELQKKYADDRQRMQTEMMALYKSHGVNPLAGCLPILLQMPVWLALYRMLSAAGELYQAQFIPGWITDLTDTDPYYILPIVLIVAMFGQAKLAPAAVDSAQQKILMYGMPLMFGVMGFFFPSGLSLYILTNTILSAIHTLYMKKTKKPPPAAAPASSSSGDKAPSASAEVAAPSDAGDKGPKGAGGSKNRKGGKRRPR